MLPLTNAYTPLVVRTGAGRPKTGCYPPYTVWSQNGELPRRLHFLPEILQESGYDTGMVASCISSRPAPYGFGYKLLSAAPYSVYSDDEQTLEYIRCCADLV
jgi:arylsulfatase A-like enzyme